MRACLTLGGRSLDTCENGYCFSWYFIGHNAVEGKTSNELINSWKAKAIKPIPGARYISYAKYIYVPVLYIFASMTTQPLLFELIDWSSGRLMV